MALQRSPWLPTPGSMTHSCLHLKWDTRLVRGRKSHVKPWPSTQVHTKCVVGQLPLYPAWMTETLLKDQCWKNITRSSLDTQWNRWVDYTGCGAGETHMWNLQGFELYLLLFSRDPSFKRLLLVHLKDIMVRQHFVNWSNRSADDTVDGIILRPLAPLDYPGVLGSFPVPCCMTSCIFFLIHFKKKKKDRLII